MSEVKIAIYSRIHTTKDGRKFTIHSTKYQFRNEDGTRTKRYIRVKFTDDAFKDSPVQLKDIKRGILVVDSKFVGCPDKYEITKDKNTGKDVYPICWIRGGIKSYEEVLKEHVFHFDSDMDVEETADDNTDLPDDEEISELPAEGQ